MGRAICSPIETRDGGVGSPRVVQCLWSFVSENGRRRKFTIHVMQPHPEPSDTSDALIRRVELKVPGELLVSPAHQHILERLCLGIEQPIKAQLQHPPGRRTAAQPGRLGTLGRTAAVRLRPLAPGVSNEAGSTRIAFLPGSMSGAPKISSTLIPPVGRADPRAYFPALLATSS